MNPTCEEDKIPTLRSLIAPDARKPWGIGSGNRVSVGLTTPPAKNPSIQTFPKAVIRSRGEEDKIPPEGGEKRH